MADTLFAAFNDPTLAERAVGALLDHGVRAGDISLVTHENYERSIARHAGPDDEDAHAPRDPIQEAREGISVTTPADAAMGAAAGAGIGLGAGALLALAALLVPGVGLVVGGGALASAIAGAVGTAAAGAVAGGVFGYLRDLGIPHEVATRYHESVAAGGAVIGVRLPSGDVGETTVREVFAKYHAAEVGRYGTALSGS